KDFEQFLNYTRVKNDTLIVPTPVWREGFVFKGWSPELVHIVTADVTYTAVWEVAKYTYSFWGVDGILKEETINNGEKIVPPTVTPTRAPDMQFTYTFSGWDKVVPEKITEDIQFFARFETTVNKYTITFVNDDGTELYTNQFDYGSIPVYEGATPTKPRNTSSLNDYTFAGWGSNITVTGDATLMAQFDAVRYAFKIEFIVDGTSVSYQIVNKKADAVMPEQPTKSGYTFAGWQKSGETTAPVLALTNVTADGQYHAVWTKI
ncbi:MAG: InlB B-repeat-containing protein, partial [Clostridia bacterium]